MSRSEIFAAARPILFNTEMVQAILEGRKTATRRVVNPQPKFFYAGGKRKDPVNENGLAFLSMSNGGKDELYVPPYQPGDILYVQETWKIHALNPAFCMMVKYRADDYCNLQVILSPSRFDKFKKFYDKNGWQSPYFMPKEAARIYLRVTDVRTERLQSITDEEAKQEGCDNSASTALGFPFVWDSTIKKADLDRYGWDANPWAWVIQFERIVPTDEN